MGMTTDEVLIRRLKRSDRPVLVELIRRAWYADDECRTSGGERRPSSSMEHDAGHGERHDPRHRSVAWRLASIDAEDCLSRTTHAAAVEYAGRVVGVILGSEAAKATRAQMFRHRLRQARSALPLLASRAGIRGLCGQLGMARSDAALLRGAGKTYAAEIVLFIVSPEARGVGFGRLLFDHMLDCFRASGIRDYFLLTDTSCDYGFYEHRGLKRMAVKDLSPAHGETLECLLYEGSMDCKGAPEPRNAEP